MFLEAVNLSYSYLVVLGYNFILFIILNFYINI